MIETRIDNGEVDILLVAEGTYPFERGGVASWIYDIISNIPDYRFGILFLGSYPDFYKEYAYPLPNNVTYLQMAYLFSERPTKEVTSPTRSYDPANIERIIKLHEVFKNSHGCPKGLMESIDDIARIIDPEKGFDYHQFLRSEESWDYIVDQYSKYSTDPSFINYFWNIRNMHEPLWTIGEAMRAAPKAKIIHTISTGYAGLLAAMLNQRRDYPLILSEHGIYTKERNIELLQSPMIINTDRLLSNKKKFTYQHELWLKFFDSIARMCYHYSDLIISLFNSAQAAQLAGGADFNKARVISNGVNIAKFSKARRPLDAPIPKIVCFIGRLVRIKDVKTFIRAVSIMVSHDREIKAWIRMVGEGDKEYMEECMDYIKLLDLGDKITFVAQGDMVGILNQIGLLIVSSISEGMPLVLLESLAGGIPAIATDVGACREIIEGGAAEDKALGTCGTVVSIADAPMLAEAAVALLNNTELWRKAQKTGITRIEKYYNQETMIKSYKEIYQKAILHGRDRV